MRVCPAKIALRLRLPGWVGVLLCASFAVGMPDQVEAGCGDYVVISNPLHPDEMTHGMPHPASQPGGPGRPACHGPTCGRRQGDLPVPTPRLVIERSEWACPIPPQPDLACAARSRVLPSAPDWCPQPALAGIFRPPRPSLVVAG